MMDYSYYYIKEIKDYKTISFDVFVSAYDGCERTKETFANIQAAKKFWLVLPQYHQSEDQLPSSFIYSPHKEESEYILEVVERLGISSEKKICIDATGFIIPHLLYLIQYIKRQGVTVLNILYSEPQQYENGEDTLFTKFVNHTRPIEGYSNTARDLNGEDTLIIFVGFDDEMVSNVAREKSKSKYKYLFTGFPSLQADMYQQNLIQLNKSKETIGEKYVYYCKAPAYDPFVAASKLQMIIDERMRKQEPINYIHIAPLSTKPMAIASALAYFNNPEAPIDIVYPSADEYKTRHSIGMKRTWIYTLEF